MWKVKRRMWKVICAAGVLSAALSTPAIDFVQTNQFTVAENSVLRAETWVSAQQLQVDGSVSNDLFATAPEMTLNGRFGGDVWCAGDAVTASGLFHNSTRILARTAQIRGTHYGSVIAAATTVKTDRTALLYGDLLCMGENVILEGSVSGSTRVLAQRVTLGGQFNGNLTVAAQEIVVLPGTLINGNFTYTAPEELSLPASVRIGGTLNRTFEAPAARGLLKQNLAGHFLFGLAALVTGLVFCGLFPRYAGTSVQALRSSPGLCSLIGFAALVMMPLAAFLMLFTLIGFPLSMLLLLFYLILLYLSKIITALWIGSLLLRRSEFSKRRAGGPLLVGLLLLYALTAFTAVSFPVNLLIIILGLGALLAGLFKKPVLIIDSRNIPQAADPSTDSP